MTTATGRRWAADGVKALHIALLLYIVFGSFGPARWASTHLCLIAVVMLHWWTNKGQCVLTQWENHLRGQATQKAEGQFVKKVFARFGLKPSRPMLFIFIYGILFASGAHSGMRWVSTF